MPSRSAPASRIGRHDLVTTVGGRPELVISLEERRVRVGIVMPVIDRVVDVSAHPVVACTTLREAATRTRTPLVDVESHARSSVTEAVTKVGGVQLSPELSLLGALDGAAFPLLGLAYRSGVHEVRDIPPWAVPVLATSSARQGAVAAFGAKATRPLVRSLATCIADGVGHQLRLLNIAVALMGRDALESDRLVRILDAQPHSPQDADLPSGETIRMVRRAAESWGPARTERVLLDVVTKAGGPRLISDTVRYARDLRGHGPRRLPSRLRALHDVYRARVTTDSQSPPPAPPPDILRRVARAEPWPDPPPPPAPRNEIFAPSARLPGVHSTSALAPAAAARAMEGATTGRFVVVLPRTAGDLTRGAALLMNCLHDFGPSAVAGHSTIIGFERDGRLHYVVELNPATVIRQFVGPANRPPTPSDRDAVVQLLIDHQVLEPSEPANQMWLPTTGT